VHAQSVLDTANRLAAAGAGTTSEAEHAQHELDMRRDALTAARSGTAASRANLARAEALLEANRPAASRPAATVTAPVGGQVLRVFHESAGPVAVGAPLLEIGDSGDIELVADLLTADAMNVHEGDEAVVTDWGGGQPLRAIVRRIEPSAFTKVSALGLEEQRVRVVLDFADAAPAGLGNSFRVTVAIDVWTGSDVVTVPSTALVREGDRWAVYAVRSGRARLQFVSPGHSDGVRTEIAQGLAAGDTVVVQPSDLVVEGVRVEPLTPPVR